MKKSFNRAFRRAEELLASPEKTDLDEELQRKLDKAVITKDFMGKMLDNIESIVGTRTFTKQPLTEQLGHQMINTGNELGATEPYGASLIQVGEYEKRLGKAQRVFFNTCIEEFLIPMQAFLEGDMKTLLREKATLMKKRLDLDSSKKRQKKTEAKAGTSMSTTATNRSLVMAQTEFDRQKEIVQLLVDRVEKEQEKHVLLLHRFVEIELNYFESCYEIISELQKELAEEKTKSKSALTAGEKSTTKVEPPGGQSREQSTTKVQPTGESSEETPKTT